MRTRLSKKMYVVLLTVLRRKGYCKKEKLFRLWWATR